MTTPLGLAFAAAPRLVLFGQRRPAAAPRPRPGVALSHRYRCHRLQPQLAAQTGRAAAASRGAAGVLERVNNQEDKTAAVRELLLSAEAPPPSAYDTAWVAMVPAPAGSAPAPRYPGCVDWILRSQRRDDGSWGPGDPSLRKDALSSTLACVLALRKWGAGGDAIEIGIRSAAGRRLCVMLSSLHAPECRTRSHAPSPPAPAPLLQGSVSSGTTGPA